jgi:hypothetical protein
MTTMTLLLSPMTSRANRPDFRSPLQREQDAHLQDLVITPPVAESAPRVRPSAETLVERLRKMQMQGWS